jgi:glycosyltransferase involved in cell wall biosynthesis
MKIVIPMFRLGEGGGVRVIVQLANDLYNKYNQNVTIITFNYSKISDLNYEVKVPVKFIRMSSIIKILSKMPILGGFLDMLYRVWKLYRNIPECDLAIANWPPTVFSVRWTKKPKYKIHFLQVYTPEIFNHFNQSGSFLKKLVRRLSNGVYKKITEKAIKMDMVKIFNNNGINMKIEKYLGIKTKYPVVPPGINLDVFYPKNKKNKINDPPVIGVIASPAPWKGTKVFFEAMKNLMERGVKIKVIAAFGPSPIGTPNVPCSKVNPRTQNELADFYRSIDILVSPILVTNEFPYPPIEAMACGTLAVSTATEYGINNVNYIEVPPYDSEAIASAIERLINDENLQKKLIKNGIKTAEKFEWNKISKKFFCLIQEFCKIGYTRAVSSLLLKTSVPKKLGKSLQLFSLTLEGWIKLFKNENVKVVLFQKINLKILKKLINFVPMLADSKPSMI